MTILKPRYKSEELTLLSYLHNRITFPEEEVKYYLKLEKGFEGEQLFDKWLEQFSHDRFILNDLLFEVNNTTFQIDTLLITQETLYQFEVKNYEGDFYVDGENWFANSGKEIKNPLLQLLRSESLLRQLIQNLGINIPIKSYLVFMNPEFHLYQAPRNLPIIFPTQLNRFMEKLNKNQSKLNGRHKKLAEQLLSKHIIESPYKRLPKYEYAELVKGIVCPNCQSFLDATLTCANCEYNEDTTSAILRSAKEFNMLFPDKKITTNSIYEWCNKNKSKRTILRILSNNFQYVGYGKSGYYIITT